MSGHLLAVTMGAVASAGASVTGHMDGINYSVIFGAFAGAVFYVAGAQELRLFVRAAYFLVSMMVGVFGAGLAGTKLAQLVGYSDTPLDGLGAILLSALAIKTLTFISQQDPAAWLTRWKGGFHGNK
ncbi:MULTISPECIES: putative holin [Erwinia]|uniref:putative holin n=1 Tax=Erwinia TaxID=551 RepID=UPI0005522AE2|nr:MULTISPECIES: putative holin [Erwinia]